MQDFLTVTGMVISVFPQNEYDRRIVLLTRERGKITAFVKGAKRQGSRFCATTDLFAFGTFDLFVGKNSYNVQNVEIQNYFEFLRDDCEASFYSMYFAELVDYYALENNDETLLLLLLYRSLQGLKSQKLQNKAVRRIFEIKLFSLEGEMIPIEKAGSFEEKVFNACDYIYESTIEKLFNLPVDEALLNSLSDIADYERKHLVDRPLKSLDMLEVMTS